MFPLPFLPPLTRPVRPEDIDWSAHYPAFFKSHANDSSADQASAPAEQATASGRGTGREQATQQAVEGSMQVDEALGDDALEPRMDETAAAVRFADVGCGFGGLLGEFARWHCTERRDYNETNKEIPVL